MSAGSDRLERSRLAILEHMHRKELRRHGQVPDQTSEHPAEVARAEGDAALPPRVHARGPRGWMDHARELLEGWWRYHPAHVAVDIARPALASYARRKPVQYLGVAAAAGAVLFFMRPWKLISVTGIVVALAKSPQVAGLIMSAMSSSQNPRDDEPVQE